jgi:hypothetical protein
MLSRANKNDQGGGRKANEKLMNDIKFNLISHRFQLRSALDPTFYRKIKDGKWFKALLEYVLARKKKKTC